MHMYINDKYICTSEAEYGARGDGSAMGGKPQGHTPEAKTAVQSDPPTEEQFLTIASMTDCGSSMKVHKGDSIVLIAEYDLKKHPL
jgi:hypothetical protein